MSIYDTILANTQQGYQNLSNQQMQIAQQPTFADKFLAGLKEREQIDFQRKMAESNYAMNLAYKQAQEEQMKQNQKLHNAQMVSLGAKYVSQNLMGEATRGPVVETLKQMGLPSSMVPELQYERTPYSYTQETMTPSLPDMSLAEGGEDVGTKTLSGEAKTPIPFSDWGAEAAFKQKGLDLREQIAQMSNESKLWVAQHKGMEPKDALQKLIFDYANSQNDPDPMKRMSANDFAQRKFFLTAKAAPDVAAWATQGVRVPAWASGSMAVSPNQIPGAVPAGVPSAIAPAVQQPVSPRMTTVPPPAPVARGATTGVVGPEPFSREGRAAAEKSAKEEASFTSTLNQMKEMENAVNGILNDSAFKSALSTKGILYRKMPKTPEYDFAQKVETLKSQLMLSALSALKDLSASGASGLGQLSNQEGEVLRKSIASLDMNMRPEAFKQSLQTILTHIKSITDLVNSRRSTGPAARMAGEFNPPSKNSGDVDTSNPLLQ